MNISISNIAWDVAEDEEVAALLAEQGVRHVDVAPSKYFPDFAACTDAEVQGVRAWWRARGIALVGMQSLLYGTQGLNVFGPPAVQERMLAHLDHVCRIGAGLAATKLVFGSPKNRDKQQLSKAEAVEVASSFFHRLGEVAAKWDVVVCLEPNPERYGCNFMTNFADTATVVQAVAHPQVKMQLDTGALTLSGEALAPFLRDHAHLVGHVHLSEPDLKPLFDWPRHGGYAPLLHQHLPHHAATVEVLTPAGAARRGALADSLRLATQTYGRHAAASDQAEAS